MRILFVNSMRSFGGGERWLMEVLEGLHERGHSVSLAARAGSALARRASADGRRVLELGMSGDLDVRSIVRLSRWMRRLSPDIVSVSIERAVRIGCLAAKLAGVAAVVERRGLDFPLRPSLVNRFIYGRCLSRVIANCEAIRTSIVATGLIPADRVTLIRNGIDPARMPARGGGAVRAEFGIDAAAPIVAILGRLVPDKGHDDGIRAFAAVARDRPSARLLVVGRGKLEDELRRLAADVAPPGSVVFAGERDDVPAILDAADVLLVTSLREGMPHVVLEAMVGSVPVVATSVAGIPEMIEDGVHGLLVPPASPERAAEALERMLSDSELAAGLATEAARRARREFSLVGMIDRIEECFQSEALRVGSNKGATA